MDAPTLIALIASVQIFLSPVTLGTALSSQGDVAVEPRQFVCNMANSPTFTCPTGPNGEWVDGVYPNPNAACSTYFFKCVNGKDYCYDCPNGLYYNAWNNECDYPYNVAECSGATNPTTAMPTTTIPPTTPTTTTPTTTTPTTTTPTTTTPTTTTPTTTTTARTTTTSAPTPEVWQCPTENGFYPIEDGVCSASYYTCVNSSPYVLTCPGSSLFDPFLYYCVSPENCGKNVTTVGPTTTASTTTPTTTTQTTTTPTTTTPTTTTPTTTTPTTTTPTTTTTRTSTTTPPVVWQCPSENGFYPIQNGVCSQNYYSCISSSPYVMSCPAGSLFDPFLRYCVPANDCGKNITTAAPTTTASTTTPTTTTPTTTTPTTTTPTTTTPTTTTPTTTTPTTTTPTTTTPSTTTPTTTTPTTTTTRTTTTPPIVWQCPTENGFYPIENGVCSQNYYSCISYSPYVLSCPAGSLFDPFLRYCVRADDCGKNITTSAPTTTASTTTPTTTTPTTTTPTTTTPTTTTPTTTTPTTTTTRTTTTPTTTRPVPFVCPTPTGNFPYPGNCTLYYVCSQNQYIVASCPSDTKYLVFVPELAYCEDPAVYYVPGCPPLVAEYNQEQQDSVAPSYFGMGSFRRWWPSQWF